MYHHWYQVTKVLIGVITRTQRYMSHSNKSYWEVIKSCGIVCYAVQFNSLLNWIELYSTSTLNCTVPSCDIVWIELNWIVQYKVILTFTCKSVHEILKWDHSDRSFRAVIPVVLFVMLYKVVMTFQSVNDILNLKYDHSNESFWGLIPVIMLLDFAEQRGCACHFSVCGWNPVVLPFKWKSWAVLSCGTVYYAVQGGSNFWVSGWNPMVLPFKWKLLSSTFLWYYL